MRYPDLPRNAQLAFNIWDVYGPRKAVLVGGTTVSLFGKHGFVLVSEFFLNSNVLKWNRKYKSCLIELLRISKRMYMSCSGLGFPSLANQTGQY